MVAHSAGEQADDGRRQGRGDRLTDRLPVDTVAIGQGADRQPFLPMIDTDTLE